MRRSMAPAAFALLVTPLLGCNLVLGLEDPRDRTTSSAGSGGAGGMGVTTSTSSSSSTTTSADGGHGGAPCDPASCPGTDCAPATCAEGLCSKKNAPIGAPCDDGGGRMCDGEGACVECLSAGDCTAPNGCQAPICDDHKCSTEVIPDGPAEPGACPNCTSSCAGAPHGLCDFGACRCDEGTTDIVQCGNACVDRFSDPKNCGECGYVCGPGALCEGGSCQCPNGGADCGGTGCVSFFTDPQHCGSCGRPCAADEVCAQGACSPAPLAAPTVNMVASPASGAAGTTKLTVTSPAGFSIGREILIHQTQGTGAGAWEEATIQAVAGNVLTLSAPLAHTYALAIADHAQAVVIETYGNLDVPVGQVLSAPAWNGATGGILAIHVAGALTVEGTVSMSARGFRGASHGCSGTTTYTCQRGQAGESSSGAGSQSILNNGSAGGGGTPGQDCGSAAGGSHGTVGGVGDNQAVAGGMCAPTPTAPDSSPGALVGDPDLTTGIFFGGAGGEGGADEDGAFPGKGGNGGGIVFIRAGSLSVSAKGRIASDGERGGNGSQIACGAHLNGSGMGGGGGGAGGAIRIVAPMMSSIGSVTALGGIGAYCAGAFDSTPGQAGAGGKGRIAIQSSISLSATTDPPYHGG